MTNSPKIVTSFPKIVTNFPKIATRPPKKVTNFLKRSYDVLVMRLIFPILGSPY